MYLFLFICSLVGFLYLIQISLYISGYRKIKAFNIKTEKIKLEDKKYLSVIIPFKNEEKNLPNLIKNLNNQTLQNKYFEVILVNDHSEDNSENTVEYLIKDIPNFYMKTEESTSGGKKKSIQTGIFEAVTNLIITTDADCCHHKEWLETILKYYIKHKPKMIIAPVLMQGTGFFEKMQSLEFMSLTASTAGAAGIGHPIMCNGANLVYEKEVYKEFKDALNMKEISGDDIFLLHNIKKKYPREISYLKSQEAVVYTKSEKSFISFFKQRFRWASKSKSYKDIDIIITSLIVFISNLLLIILFALSPVEITYLKAATALLILKTIPDLTLISLSAGYFNTKKLLRYFPVTILVYPIYIVITSIAGICIKKISWK